MRGSNVHLPVELAERIDAHKARRDLSNGELVIEALEACHARLDTLLGHRAPTGGGLFTQRVTRRQRAANGPLFLFNFRLREDDFAVIDDLVTRHGAYSRTHLITAALTDYLSSAR